MGKLHVKGWGRKTNYLNGKVACQGLGVGVGKKCTQNQYSYTTWDIKGKNILCTFEINLDCRNLNIVVSKTGNHIQSK